MKETFNQFPNLFYDLICRVLPGLLIIILWVSPDYLLEPSGVQFAALLILAWGLGMILDNSILFFAWLGFAMLVSANDKSDDAKSLKANIDYRSPLGALSVLFEFHNDKLSGLEIYKLHPGRTSSIIRAAADLSFFRSLFFLCLLSLVMLPRLSELRFPRGAFICVAGFLFFCWAKRAFELRAEKLIGLNNPIK